MKLYFRSLSIIGKKLFNFLYRPRLLAGTVHATGIFHQFSHSDMYTNASYNIQLYWRTPLAVIPLANPFFTYLAPSSCDRNRPPQSQVARKLTPFVPHWLLVPSLPKSRPLLDFPGPNVHPIRATSQTQPLVYSTNIASRASPNLDLSNKTTLSSFYPVSSCPKTN